MKDYGKVRSTVQPESLLVDDYSVWVHTDIQEVSENVGEENEFVGYEYSMVQYDKDEFIAKQAEDNAALQDSVDNAMLGLCEIYESLQ